MSRVSPRPISSDELAVLQAALTRAPTPGTPLFADSYLQALIVHSQCNCGCASVGFLPEGTTPNANTKPIADGLGLSTNSKQVGVIVHGSQDQLVELELHWPYTDGAPLPRPETIVPWGRGEEVRSAEK